LAQRSWLSQRRSYSQPEPELSTRQTLCNGVARRHGNQKATARASLEDALAIFEQLGARLWADKARTELRRISGRRAAGEQLTEAELQVATLAAHGESNRHIAAALYMGLSTVEAHLSRVYRKLGVGRAEPSLPSPSPRWPRMKPITWIPLPKPRASQVSGRRP
jgi:ATP/maltotriose-dependent transcriptional regulator MalT